MIHLCDLTDIDEGQSRGFALGALAVLVVRREGHVYVYENRCPHRGIGLEWTPDRFLDESGSLIQCATHGALFLIESGECVAGPCAGQFLRPLAWQAHAGGIWLQDAQPCDP